MSDTKSLLVIAVVAAIVVMCMCSGGDPKKSTYGCNKKKSYYTLSPASVDVPGSDLDQLNDDYASVDSSEMMDIECAMGAGVGLASSLLPREMASQEDFGQFAPDDILKGQNFLDPRNQIGFPETLGGTLRNANQQIRAEPPNPKRPYTFNNSTIVPDLMQRKLC